MIRKYSWLLFVLVGVIGVVMSLAFFVNPATGLETLAGVGPALPAGLVGDPFGHFVMRWTATALIGTNAITILVAATAFRRGERWAGVAMCYWPLMFLSHLLMYANGPMRIVQVVWLALTVPSLIVHFRRSPELERHPVGMAAQAAQRAA